MALGIQLITTPERHAQIAGGEHEITTVDGKALTFPSQRLDIIESTNPGAAVDTPQSHTISRHVGWTFAQDLARLAR